jgi:hypothetical protein
VSAFFSDMARDIPRSLWIDRLPGSVLLVVLATALLLVVQRELTRGILAGEREQRVRAATVILTPLLLCAALALGSRLLALVT